MFDFKSICVLEGTIRDTNTTTWIGKHVPISLSIPSNLVQGPIFLYNSDPHHLAASFNGTLEGWALQSKAQMKLLIFDNETTIKTKVGSILEKHTQRHNRREHVRFDKSQDDCENEICAKLNSYRYKKNQLIDH